MTCHPQGLWEDVRKEGHCVSRLVEMLGRVNPVLSSEIISFHPFSGQVPKLQKKAQSHLYIQSFNK
jgi:hypothetical protein